MSVPVPSAPSDQPSDAAPPADARLAAELRELLGHVSTSWDNERRALSRQLHDNLGSSLTALTMHLGLLAQKMPAEPALQDRAAHMKQLLHTIIDGNRQMQVKLWNDKLEFLGVRVALSELVQQFGEIHALTARCSLPDEDLECPRGHGVVLLRALEEGLRNITLHSQASEVDVIVDDNEDQIMLTVRDNGIGLGGAADPAAGKFGLRVMRERALHLGGSLTLHDHSDKGAVLTLILPKPAKA